MEGEGGREGLINERRRGYCGGGVCDRKGVDDWEWGREVDKQSVNGMKGDWGEEVQGR